MIFTNFIVRLCSSLEKNTPIDPLLPDSGAAGMDAIAGRKV